MIVGPERTPDKAPPPLSTPAFRLADSNTGWIVWVVIDGEEIGLDNAEDAIGCVGDVANGLVLGASLFS